MNQLLNARRLTAGSLACILLAGCAAPIRSRIDDPSASGAREGFRYFLTKTNVSVTIRARLDSCGDEEQDKVNGRLIPRITLLKPTTMAKPASDHTAAYWVTPKDAWNMFRSIDSAEIVLTDDGRIATSSAKVTDKTVEVLLELVKTAAGIPGLMNFESTRSSEASDKARNEELRSKSKALPAACTEEVLAIDRKRSTTDELLKDLKRARSRLLLSGVVMEGTRETISVLDEAIAKQKAALEALNEALTRSVTLDLSPTEADSQAVESGRIDIASGWLVNAKSDHLNVNVKIERKRAATPATPTAQEHHAAPGIFYRVPPQGIPLTIIIDRLASNPLAVVAVEERNPVLVGVNAIKPATLSSGERYESKSSPFRMLQWGHVALMPSDVGWLTSNSVKTAFDEWGVPKSASWSATPATIPGLLGVVNQADAALSRKPTQADPVGEQRTEVLMRLLQICKDAPPGEVPSFCAALVK